MQDKLREQVNSMSPEDRELLELLLVEKRGLPSDTVIQPRSRAAGIPLSYAQQRMWLLNQLEPWSNAYNMPNAYRLIGPLDISALEQSLRALVARHATLRTVYTVRDGMPQQIIREEPLFKLEFLDLTHLAGQEQEAVTVDRIVAECEQPFDLTQDLLMRALLVALAPEEHILSIVMHHIASDGWSMAIFRRELADLYAAYARGATPKLPALPIQYADYAIWQRERLQGQRLEAQLSYWRNQLADISPLSLPISRLQPAIRSHHGGSCLLVLPPELAQSLHSFSQRSGATLFMTLLAAFGLLLQRYCGQNDIAIGTIVANRRITEVEGLIGFFLNTLVLRSDFSGDPAFSELLARVRRVALDAYDHQDIPFEKLLEELVPERHLSLTPLFSVLMVLQNMPSAQMELAGLQVEPLPFDDQISRLDLSLYLMETADGLQARFEYSTDLFDAGAVERLAAHFQELLESIVAGPNTPISRLVMLPGNERKMMLEDWNRTGVDLANLPDLITQFYAQVTVRPHATAFLVQENRLSYAQLNDRSNRLAHYLLAQGLAPEARIGVCLKRSLDVPVALLAIFKLGGVYVPLDPGYPAERLHFILHDAGVVAVITERRSLLNLALAEDDPGRPIWCLDELADVLAQQPSDDLKPGLTPDQSAYIIYTSGSTGKPKGVTVPHRQVLNRLGWMWQRYPLSAGEVGCQKTALNFVDSMWELLGYLLQGVPTVVIADDDVRDPRRLVEVLAQSDVTRLWLVPSLLRTMLDTHPDLQARLPRLRFWVSSGEALTTALYQRFGKAVPEATLYNLYGTSEVWDVTWFDPDEPHTPWHGATVPIGRPISNVRTIILDRDGQPVPVGVPGELCVSGAGLGDGYINQPDLTGERFVTPPWIPHLRSEPALGALGAPASVWTAADRIYRTGDLAYWLADGNIEFLGRKDTQIKLRGHRIELEEIETLLDRHPKVRQSVATVHAAGTAKERLVAYCVPKDDLAPVAGDLIRFLRTVLPETMIPSLFVMLDALPLTPSGKVDRRSLPEPDGSAAEWSNTYEPPRTQEEERLAPILAEVLGLERVGIHDRFFEIGGHSLLGIQFFSRIEEEFGQRLPFALLFSAPTVALLSEHLAESHPSDRDRTLVPIQEGGSLAPFFCVHGFGGGVLGYADLAHLLGPDRPFYGLQAYGLDGRSPGDTTIEDMASRYIAAMREVQPHGPYRVGGYCFGGVVAFEMARQLEESSEHAIMVAIMEGYAPKRFQRRASAFSVERWQTVWENIPYWLGDYWSLGLAGVHLRVRRRGGILRKHVLHRLGKGTEINAQDLVPNDLSRLPDHHRKLMETHLQALRAYAPKPIRGAVTLYAARGKTISQALFGSGNPEHGWGSLARGGVEVKVVEGGHRNIHLQPYVQSLAEALDQDLHAMENSELRPESSVQERAMVTQFSISTPGTSVPGPTR